MILVLALQRGRLELLNNILDNSALLTDQITFVSLSFYELYPNQLQLLI